MCGILCIIDYDRDKTIDVQSMMEKIKSRGPDRENTHVVHLENIDVFMGFTRLSIMDTSDLGLQPFIDDKSCISICNGEIYNHIELKKKYSIHTLSECDCEVILPVYHATNFVESIRNNFDAEFAVVIYDNIQKKIYAARDRYGVRPLYYGYNKTTQKIGLASELKALHATMEFVTQLPPSDYIMIDLNEKFNHDININNYYSYDKFFYNNNNSFSRHEILQTINNLLTNAVAKRLNSDRNIGFLLSGGLDSSLIVAIACKILGNDKIVCFSVGMENSCDVLAAKKVVEYLGIKNHHIISFDNEMGITFLDEVIDTIETYDVTTIRASTPQYIMANYIKKNTDIKVLLSGEGSDEIHGSYRYFRDAWDDISFHNERIRLLQELYMFDNQRTDRTMADNGLEVRVPFLDNDYVDYILSLDAKLFMYNNHQMEKQIIRDSFKGYLPDELLYRSKEAFSDAVSASSGLSWVEYLKHISNKEITDHEFDNNTFTTNPPKTKDALYLRKIFDNFYEGRDNIIPHYWLPKFQKEPVYDPSATLLKCY